MEKYLEQILATEEEARKIEQDARDEAEKVIADATARSEEEVQRTEERAQTELAKLRTRAEADASEQVARLKDEYKHITDDLEGRYREKEERIMEGARQALDAILSRSED